MEVETASGPARVLIEEPDGMPLFLVALTHGAGGGGDTPDLLAVRDAALRLGGVVARITQPYRVRGARAPGSVARQDAAWVEIITALLGQLHGEPTEPLPPGSGVPLPAGSGGRSCRARVCRSCRARVCRSCRARVCRSRRARVSRFRPARAMRFGPARAMRFGPARARLSGPSGTGRTWAEARGRCRWCRAGEATGRGWPAAPPRRWTRSPSSRWLSRCARRADRIAPGPLSCAFRAGSCSS